MRRNGSVSTGARTSATVGSYLRGGADFHFARSFTIGVDAGYNWVADFAQPVGARRTTADSAWVWVWDGSSAAARLHGPDLGRADHSGGSFPCLDSGDDGGRHSRHGDALWIRCRPSTRKNYGREDHVSSRPVSLLAC